MRKLNLDERPSSQLDLLLLYTFMTDTLRPQAPANQCEGSGIGGELVASDDAPGSVSAKAASQPVRSDMQRACI